MPTPAFHYVEVARRKYVNEVQTDTRTDDEQTQVEAVSISCPFFRRKNNELKANPDNRGIEEP